VSNAGLNGNFHGPMRVKERLADLGVRYLGDGAWDLPDGAEIVCVSNEDWHLMAPDGRIWHVWSSEE
jgi:hypothetical protein